MSKYLLGMVTFGNACRVTDRDRFLIHEISQVHKENSSHKGWTPRIINEQMMLSCRRFYSFLKVTISGLVCCVTDLRDHFAQFGVTQKV